MLSFYEANMLMEYFLFSRDPENLLPVKEVTFLPNKAPCFKTIQTEELLRNSNIDFFSQ